MQASTINRHNAVCSTDSKRKKNTISKVKLETKFTHFLWDRESVHSTKYTFIELSVNTQFELCKTVNSGWTTWRIIYYYILLYILLKENSYALVYYSVKFINSITRLCILQTCFSSLNLSIRNTHLHKSSMKKLHFPQNRYKEVMNFLKRQAQHVTTNKTLLWDDVESTRWEDRWKLSNSACLYRALVTRQMLKP